MATELVSSSSQRGVGYAPSASEQCLCGGTPGQLHVESLLHRRWLWLRGLLETAEVRPLMGDDVLDPKRGVTHVRFGRRKGLYETDGESHT